MIASPHFDVFRAANPGPVVVEIPHAGVVIDEPSAAFTRIPPEAIAAGALLADSDLGADAVWSGVEDAGVTRVVARTSRYVIDLNTEPRLPTPYEEKLPAPLRSVLHRSQCGVSFRQDPLPRSEIERRIREVLEPYHGAIDRELQDARARYGGAVLLSSHTFPDQQNNIADVVLGTQHGESASAQLRDAIADVFRAAGLSVALEAPFSGGWALTRHARPAEGISVVQIEIARRLVCQARDGCHLAVDTEAIPRISCILGELAAVLPRFLTATASSVD